MVPNSKSSEAIIDNQSYKLIAFYFPGHNTPWDDYYQAPFLGNFWESKLMVNINNISGTFLTSEAAFQATKWWDNDSIRLRFENAKTGNEAFQIKKYLSVPADYSYAGLGRDGAMMSILESKFTNKALKSALINTGNSYLLEHNTTKGRDDYWSDDKDGINGKNMLGITLMNLREKLGGFKSPYNGDIRAMSNLVKT